MKMKKSLSLVSSLGLILFLTLVLAGISLAHTHWRRGTVTKIPWQGRHRYIEIDKQLYTFMPEATVVARWQSVRGNFNQRPFKWNRVRVGQKVLMSIQGCRIYKLVVLE